MDYDIAIIGAGIIGMATALEILKKLPNKRVVVIEKESSVAQHQSSHNSGVIHSGLYYKPGSLKAENCINGYKKLIRFCEDEGIKYELCGKIVVATKKRELPLLDRLYSRGMENGLQDLRFLDQEEIRNY